MNGAGSDEERRRFAHGRRPRTIPFAAAREGGEGGGSSELLGTGRAMGGGAAGLMTIRPGNGGGDVI